jgi:nitroreductase
MTHLMNEIKSRRAYRSLKKIEITSNLIEILGQAVQLSPSCFNNQPWHFIFTYEKKCLNQLFEALSKGNVWATHASMIISVCAKKEDDCLIHDREYYLFDLGLASSFLILQATKMGLVAHPIAGYSPKKVREILSIPDDYMVIALIIVGKHNQTIPDYLSEKQVEAEKMRPPRKSLETFIHHNIFVNEELE